MIPLFIIDVLVYNVTTYNFPLIIFSLPNLKSFKVSLIIFLALAALEYRYLFLMAIMLVIYLVNKLINKELRSTNLTYYILLIIDYVIYFLLYNLLLMSI